jgi:hypothetical protein
MEGADAPRQHTRRTPRWPAVAGRHRRTDGTTLVEEGGELRPFRSELVGDVPQRLAGLGMVGLEEGLADRRLEPLVRIRDHQLHPAQAAADHALEEARPERPGLAWADVQADDLASAFGVGGHGDYRRHRDDPPALALAQPDGIQPEIGPFPAQGAVEEGVHPLVDVPAQPGNRALAEPGQPHRLHQVVHPPGRDPTDPGFLDHRHQRLLRGLPRLQEGREVAALAQPGDPQLQAAQAGVQRPVAVAIAVGRPIAAAFVPPGADQALHVGFHQHLHHRLRHAAQEVAISGFGQQLGQGYRRFGHRVLSASG